MRRQIGFVVLMAVIAGSAGRCVGWAKDEVTIAPAPSGEQLSDDFQVNVDGQPAPVYRCRVSAVPLNQGGGVVYLHDCSDSVIDGIVMRDPDVWCCWLRGCRNARIANVKLVGLWRYNSDGIDLCNSRDISVTGRPSPDSQLRGFDADHGVEGIVFENVRIHGRAVTDADASRIAIGPHVRDVKFLVPDASAPAKE